MRVLSLFTAFLMLALPVLAQDGIPQRRAVYQADADFNGGDLRSIFDTTLEMCERTCLGEAQCEALTYNTNASACFLKTGKQKATSFSGALSARMIKNDESIRKSAPARLADLSFLSENQLLRAQDLATSIGRTYPLDMDPRKLASLALNAERNGNLDTAVYLRAQMAGAFDTSASWIDLARMARANSERNQTYRMRRLATEASINAYLRADRKKQQSLSLLLLAGSLEKEGNGARSVPTLRLAQTINPNKKTNDAFERAIGMFGFRVVENQVDSNGANPRICVTFSEDLAVAGVTYGDFVRIDSADLPVMAEGRNLCIEGVEHGARHTFTLRAGLPSASGQELHKSVEISVYVRDRGPSVRFAGRSYVLPKTEIASIPVTVVNAKELEVKIFRVTDRNLVSALQQNMFASPIGYYQEGNIQDRLGEQVWSGTADVKTELNKDITTDLPIGQALSSFEPGVYALKAVIPDEDSTAQSQATQWFIVTDLGLATLSGSDGLHVFVRGLSDAQARKGVNVSLIASNNEILGTLTTDAQGYAVFPTGLTRGERGYAPALLTAEIAEDYAFLDLTDAAFDLSDRGVEGRASPPPIDVFATTDRGIYRPGETVHLTALARDPTALALTGLPLTSVLTRPDGVEYTRKVLADIGAGGRAHSFDLSDIAQRGVWRLNLHADPKKPALTSVTFLVEDFEPERIDFDLSLPEGAIEPYSQPKLGIEARYLYGAPGADLKIEGEVRVSTAPSLAGFKQFRFGLQNEPFQPKAEAIKSVSNTDADGRASIPLALPEIDPQSHPLLVTAILRLRDSSGRPVERYITRPLAAQTPLIGIRPLFDGVVKRGEPARFEVVAVDTDGTQMDLANTSWTLSRIRTTYQWYNYRDRWNYEPVIRKEQIAGGVVTLDGEKRALLEAPVDWDQYELKLINASDGYVASSMQFSSGWYSVGSGTDTPDRLDISLDKKAYSVGDTVRVQLEPRDAGQVLISVLTDRLIDMKTISVEPGEVMVELPVTADWGPGAYVSATLVQPADRKAGRNPARSIGLSWVEVDPGDAKLDAKFISPAEANPRQTMNAELEVTGVAKGDTAWVTIAAVDLGILNVTGFKSPDPQGHYFGQRKLGIEIRDLYGRLIDSNQGTLGRLRSGGDGAGSGPSGPKPTQDPVALFSGPLQVGQDGRVKAAFDMPDFNGTVKLMAVVWSEKGVGQAQQNVLVRDPIVVSASLPRFMAPGDKSRLLLELAHATGPSGKVKVEISSTKDVVFTNQTLSVSLSDLGRQIVSLPMTADGVSDNKIRVSVTTPAGQVLTKDLRMAIRANDPEISRQSHLELAKGKVLTLDSNIFAGLVPGTGRVTLTAGPLARFDVPGLLTALDRYPYGCTEQMTSRAFPLLYFEQVSAGLGLKERSNVRERVDQAIARILNNQARSGGFGLWGPSAGDLWLDAYVTDFLSRAKQNGYDVPEHAFTSAIDNLRNQINYAADFEDAGQGIAYALLVLSRERAASIGDLRYYADTKADDFATPLAKGQVGAALAAYGDQVRADRMFKAAYDQIVADRANEKRRRFLWRADYGSSYRDAAALLTLAVEAGSNAVDRDALAKGVAIRSTGGGYQSTQEMAWSLLASNALIVDPGATGLTRNDVPVEGALIDMYEAETLAGETVRIRNTDKSRVPTVITTFGVPADPEPAQGNGYKIIREYYTLDGKPANRTNVQQNDRLVVILTVTPERTHQARLMVNDPLPAGLEIDNPNLIRAGDIGALDWLQLDDVAQHTEFRTDRFMAAVDHAGKEPFRLGYIVRAISPGQFHHPAASVEDMYRPAFRARTDVGVMNIASVQ